jgi:hypothetical protein
MHVRVSLLLIGLLLLQVGFTSAGVAQGRVALVVGNSHYAAVGTLANPANDAEDVAAALIRLGFSTTLHLDLSTRQFDDALDSFLNRSKDAEVAIFFYAGHGLSIDKKGYLVPIDTTATTESRALRELVSIQEIVSRIEQASKASIIILDACRDNALSERVRRITNSETRGLQPPGRGLAPVTVIGSNTLVVYATVPGETANDGIDQRNSPFTAALLRHIETPGLEIQTIFTRVTNDVLQSTKGKQQPERLSRLQTEVTLKTGEALPPFKPQSFAEYLSRFPYASPGREALASAERASAIRKSFSTLASQTEVNHEDPANRLKLIVEKELGSCQGACPAKHIKIEQIGVQRIFGRHVRIYAVFARDEGSTCHACSVMLSLFEVVDYFGKGELGANAVNIGKFGFWGDPPDIAFTPIGPDRYAIAVNQGYTNHGNHTESQSLLMPIGGTYLKVFDVIIGESYDSTRPSSTTQVHFIPRPGHFFAISTTKTIEGKAVEAIMYEFDERSGSYRQLAKKAH